MSVEALIVNTARRGPGQLLGLDGIGAGEALSTPNVIDSLTGGEFSRVQERLDRLELYLQISIIASCVAGVAGLATLFRRR